MGASERGSIPHNPWRSLSPLILQHRNPQPSDRVSPSIHILRNMDGHRSLHHSSRQHICPSPNNGPGLGSTHRRSRRALVCRSNQRATATYRTGVDSCHCRDRRSRLQLHAGESEHSQDFNVVARVRRQGPVCPEPLFKCPTRVRHSTRPALLRSGPAMARVCCQKSQTLEE